MNWSTKRISPIRTFERQSIKRWVRKGKKEQRVQCPPISLRNTTLLSIATVVILPHWNRQFISVYFLLRVLRVPSTWITFDKKLHFSIILRENSLVSVPANVPDRCTLSGYISLLHKRKGKLGFRHYFLNGSCGATATCVEISIQSKGNSRASSGFASSPTGSFSLRRKWYSLLENREPEKRPSFKRWWASHWSERPMT